MTAKPALRERILPAALTAAAVLVLLIGLWSADSLQGADTWGHLARAEYLAGLMRSEGPGAYFRAAWMPNWYLGDPFLTYYPPLTTLLLAPLIYVFGNSEAAVRILISVFLIGFSALTYFYLQRTWNRWAAFLGTVLAVAAPYQIRTILFEGNLPRMLSLLALPAIAILTDRLLARQGRRAPAMILLGVCWAWAILAHPQQALIFAVGVGLYVIFRLILDPEVPLYQLAPWLVSILLGALLAGPWLLPAYSHGELADVPFLPAEKIPLFSASLQGFLPYLDLTHGQILFGFGALLIGLLAISVRPEPRRSAWFLAGLIAIWFSLGPNGVLFSLLPFHSQFLPERFVNFAAFGIPIAAGGLLPMRKDLRWIRGTLLAILVTVDLIPSLRIFTWNSYPQEQAALAAVSDPQGGRVALLTYPEPTSLEIYFSGRNADLINGWALENTPHHVALRRVLSAPEWGPDYLEALFNQWDVRTVVIAGGGEADGARESAAAMGFARELTLGRYEIWRKDVPSARVQVIPAQSMLIVGDQLTPFVAAFPFAEETSPDEFARSQSGRLEEYPVLGLYRFAANPAGVGAFEDSIRGYVEAGGTAVVDLSGMEDLFGRTLDFFGVHAFRLSFDDRIPLTWTDASSRLPAQLHLDGLIEQGWSGAAYEGLDVVLASVERDGSSFAVWGYKNVGAGKIWFVGANLLYYAQLTDNGDIRGEIRGEVLKGIPLSTDPALPAVPVRGYAESADGLRFDYELDESAIALVSYTYSPRWRATVDGRETEVTVRDNLIRIALPAGIHTVEITYHPFGTIWPVLGILSLVLGVAAGAACVWAESKWRKAVQAKREFQEIFQKPESLEGDAAYAPCAHCGFRLAENRPPTPITYPFHVSHCPICGACMDDEGFNPGRDLTREEQVDALHKWLRANHYDPRTIHTKWGFSPEEFFTH
jgi:hypothetical protein